MSKIVSRGLLEFPMETLDPFLFAVYHKDEFPPANAPLRVGNGMDFDQNAKYRMYHSRKNAGFPSHPHRGFETITCTIEGLIDHTDSLGCGGRYGQGDCQFMTAGKGIVHAEMFPLVKTESPNMTRFFQLWINLPKKSKTCPPTQKMHWAEDVPKISKHDGKLSITLWAGELEGVKAIPPTPNSWAADPANNVRILYMKMEAGTFYTLPATPQGTNRMLYIVEGKVLVEESPIPEKHYVQIKDVSDVKIAANDGGAEILVLEGKPIGEPVIHRGPFVANTQQEMQEAFAEYSKTQFGGWPWDSPEMVFPRDQGRFLKINGEMQLPPKS